MINDLCSHDEEAIRNYITIGIIAHEVEHSYQYLMSKGIINSPNDVVKDAYKYIFDITLGKDFEGKNIDLLQELYIENQNKILLERNAEIERFDLLMKLAEYNSRNDLHGLFKWLKDWHQTFGYHNSNIGSIHETFKILQLEDLFLKFNHNVIMDDDERMRYGFPISDELRLKILKK